MEICAPGKVDFSIDMDINCYKSFRYDLRFGVDARIQRNFILDFLNLHIDGIKICDTFTFRWENTSVHAENFLWNVIAYRVRKYIILYIFTKYIIYWVHYQEITSLLGTQDSRTPSGGIQAISSSLGTVCR